MNYVDENVILFFGRILGYKNDDIRLFSSCEIKMNVWRGYKKVWEEIGK